MSTTTLISNVFRGDGRESGMLHIPSSSGSRYSLGENNSSGDIWREEELECDDRGGVGRLESGT